MFQKSATNVPGESRQSLNEAQKDPLKFAAVCSEDCTQTGDNSKRGKRSQTSKSEFAKKTVEQQKPPSKKRCAEPTARTAKRTRQSEEDTANPPCFYCYELFTSSKSREKWIKCTECFKWAHNACAGT